MVTIHHVRIEEHGDHVHVHGLPEHLEGTLGDVLHDLHKAEKAEPPDPRWPQFARILDGALRPWNTWLEWLLAELDNIGLRRGPDPKLAARIQQRLREHEAGVIAATTGSTLDEDITTALVKRGALAPSFPTTAPVAQAFALGLGSDPSRDRELGETSAPLQPRSVAELGALSYARDRAAAYMRKPVDAVHRAVKADLSIAGVPLDARALTPEERALVAAEVQDAVAEDLTSQQLAARLREAVQGNPQLANDMDRVARTELAFALNHGALAALKAGMRPGEDPEVVRIVSPSACEDCRRLFGPPEDPIVYRLSVVEAWEAAGGNFRLPKREWRAGIGTVHPGCLCPPFHRHSGAAQRSAQRMAAKLRRGY